MKKLNEVNDLFEAGNGNDLCGIDHINLLQRLPLESDPLASPISANTTDTAADTRVSHEDSSEKLSDQHDSSRTRKATTNPTY